MEFAQRALALDDSHPGPHSFLSAVSLFNRQHEQAIAEAELALTLGPNMPINLVWMAVVLDYTGRPQEAIGLVEKALRLDPKLPGIYLPVLGLAYILTGQYEEGIVSQQRAIALLPSHLFAHVNLTLCYMGAGRETDAQAAAKAVLRLNPNFSLERFGERMPFKDPADLERILAALRKAGLK